MKPAGNREDIRGVFIDFEQKRAEKGEHSSTNPAKTGRKRRKGEKLFDFIRKSRKWRKFRKSMKTPLNRQGTEENFLTKRCFSVGKVRKGQN